MDELPELINLPEAARRLGLTPARLHQLKGEGRIAFLRIGREWITTADEVERFGRRARPRGAAGHLAKRQTASTAPAQTPDPDFAPAPANKPTARARNTAPVDARVRAVPKPIGVDSIPVRRASRDTWGA